MDQIPRVPPPPPTPGVTPSTNGIGFTSALFLIFLVLKLTHVIDWSWWWIFAPFWGTLALAVVIGGLIGAVRGIKALRGKR